MNLDNSYKVFLELLKTGLFLVHGERFNANESLYKDVDWEKVYLIAKEQSVQGLVLQGIETVQGSWLKVHGSPLVPKVLLLQWIGELQIIEQRNKKMNAFVADLIERLRKMDVYSLLVKGQGIAQCYDRPLWRSSGDVDLFLSNDNYEKAKQFLLPLSSSTEEEFVQEKHLGMIIDGWVVELHGHLYSGLSFKVEDELDELQNDTFYRGQVRSWMNGQTQVFLLKAENDAFYVFTHILQHFFKGGVGLRQICDWCRLLYTYRNSLDHELLEQRIKRAGLTTEWKAFGALAVGYLGMPVDSMPFYFGSNKWKKKADKLLAFILETGNFGHNRDMSYRNEKSAISRKWKTFYHITSDTIKQFSIFPMDSIRVWCRMMGIGLLSLTRK